MTRPEGGTGTGRGRADRHGRRREEALDQRRLAGLVGGVARLLVGGLQLGEGLVDALLGLGLRQAGTLADQARKPGAIARVEAACCSRWQRTRARSARRDRRAERAAPPAGAAPPGGGLQKAVDGVVGRQRREAAAGLLESVHRRAPATPAEATAVVAPTAVFTAALTPDSANTAPSTTPSAHTAKPWPPSRKWL